MRRTSEWWIGGVLLLGLACSQPPAAPEPAAPSAAPPPSPASSQPTVVPAPPDTLTPERAEEARRAVEAALEDVRRQIEQKAAALGAEPVPQQP